MCSPVYAGVDFNGDADVISLGDLYGTSLDTTDFSIIALIKTDSLNVEKGIFGQRQAYKGKAFALRPAASGQSKIGISSVEATWAESTGVISDNDWHFVGATCDSNNIDATTVRFFIDGAFDSQDTTEEMVNITAGGVSYIGSVVAGGLTPASVFNGCISDVIIYSSILSDDDIISIMKAKMKRFALQVDEGNLAAYYPLDDHAAGTGINGKTYKDLSGNGNDGTGVDADADSTNVGEEILNYPPAIGQFN
jgi:hypothetical protein